MESLDELQKRTQDAGVRFARTEIEMVSSLLARIPRAVDARERSRCLREARATLELAARLGRTLLLSDPRTGEITNGLQELSQRLEALSAMVPKAAARRTRMRRMAGSV
jgi:hypothetical protein